MEQKTVQNTESMKKANDESIYKMLLVGILIGIVGVYLRFAHDSYAFSMISWVLLVIGAIICFKSVFKILSAE